MLNRPRKKLPMNEASAKSSNPQLAAAHISQPPPPTCGQPASPSLGTGHRWVSAVPRHVGRCPGPVRLRLRAEGPKGGFKRGHGTSENGNQWKSDPKWMQDLMPSLEKNQTARIFPKR